MTNNHAELLAKLKTTFQKQFGYDPSHMAQAPGRVNLIGDHTDYNQGLVLPAAIDRQVVILARPKTGLKEKTCTVYSLDYQASDSFSLGSVQATDSDTWKNYFRGLVSVWQKAGLPLVAFEAALGGDIPQGAGLSSSAAYLVACAKLLNEMNDTRLSNLHIALLAQQAEGEFVGVKCGLMDQLVSCMAVPDSALLIDFNTLECKAIPLNLAAHGYSILVTHSGVARNLSASDYNDRRRQCEQAVNLLAAADSSVYSLRDIDHHTLTSIADNFPTALHNRVRHVLEENARVQKAVDSLERGDMAGFGQLMNNSHRSLKDFYQVSSKELDLLVSLSQRLDGVAGSRMTGAGFGGCTVTLIESESIEAFNLHVIRPYEQTTGLKTEVHLVNFVGGASASALSSVTAQPAAASVHIYQQPIG
jgi:galactokinase